MKKILTVIGMAVLGVAIVYLGFASSELELNPARWDDKIRLLGGMCMVVYLAIAVLIGVVYYSLSTEEKEENE